MSVQKEVVSFRAEARRKPLVLLTGIRKYPGGFLAPDDDLALVRDNVSEYGVDLFSPTRAPS